MGANGIPRRFANKKGQLGQDGKTKIYSLDDHPVAIEGLRTIISRQEDVQVVGSSEEAKIALADLAKLKPDLVILDLTLKDYSGVDLIRKIRQVHPVLKILVFSMHDENVYAERCLRVGAMGYLAKGERIDRILQAIRQVK